MAFSRPVGTPTINWDHPLATRDFGTPSAQRILDGCWLPDGAGAIVDIAGNYPPLASGAFGSPSSNSFGPSIALNGTTQFQYETGTCGIADLQQATIAVIGSATTASPNATGFMFQISDSTNSYHRLSLEQRLTNGVLVFHVITPKNDPSATSAAVIGADAPFCAIGVCDMRPGAPGFTAYLNGASVLTGALAVDQFTGFNSVCIGNRVNVPTFTASLTSGANPVLSAIVPTQVSIGDPITGHANIQAATVVQDIDRSAGTVTMSKPSTGAIASAVDIGKLNLRVVVGSGSASMSKIFFSGWGQLSTPMLGPGLSGNTIASTNTALGTVTLDGSSSGSQVGQTFSTGESPSKFGGKENMAVAWKVALTPDEAAVFYADPVSFLAYPPACPSFRFRG